MFTISKERLTFTFTLKWDGRWARENFAWPKRPHLREFGNEKFWLVPDRHSGDNTCRHNHTHLALKFLAISTLEKFKIDLRIFPRGFEIDAHHRWRHLSSAKGTSKEWMIEWFSTHRFVCLFLLPLPNQRRAEVRAPEVGALYLLLVVFKRGREGKMGGKHRVSELPLFSWSGSDSFWWCLDGWSSSLSTTLDLLGLSKAADGRAEDSCRVGGKDVGAAGHRLLAGLAGPDAHAGALHRLLKRAKRDCCC